MKLEKRNKCRRLLPALILASIATVVVGAFWVAGQYLGPNIALLNALERHNIPAAELALQHGADPNLMVERCWPTHLLSDHVSFFYHKVINPKEEGDWPLLFAETARQDAAAVRLLLEHGANPDARIFHTNALKIARNNGYKEIAGLLERAGASE
jgi:ankyrin repeat protein